MNIRCLLIRHGKTKGNLEKRYIGCKTDEPLLEDSAELLGFVGEKIVKNYGIPSKVIVSPMLRCRQTAELLFTEAKQIVVDDLRETDFGYFENKNYADLCNNPEYQSWIDSNGTKPFPGGEDRESCIDRTVVAFHKTIASVYEEECEKRGCADIEPGEGITVAFVIHGGSVMAIMSTLTGRDYYDFQVGCIDGYVLECSLDNGKIIDVSYDSLFGGNCT